MKISGWGNYPKIESNLYSFSSIEDLKHKMDALDHFVVRGAGLSYGDSALNTNGISTLRFNRILEFDEKKGFIRAEAGACLTDVIQRVIPKGWFLSVTPGTKFITVGGAIASDVHGKNHHKMGTFSDRIRSMDVMLPDSQVVTCSISENYDLFRATCSGMGLTGIILNATIELKKIETAYIKQGYQRARNLDELIDLFEQYKDVSYSIAWIDCLSPKPNFGRGILILGEHATREDVGKLNSSKRPLYISRKPALRLPFEVPRFALNPYLGKTFNFLFFHSKSTILNTFMVDYDSFFYPLDRIHNWNRIYGTSGSTEYQVVFPKDSSREGLKSLINRVNNSGFNVFLAGLKLFGKQNDNLLSFPMHGYTLSLEFPIDKGLFRFLNELDKLVLEYGGRLYLSKDVRMNDVLFKQTYTHADQFIKLKRGLDKLDKLQSLQSKRLKI